MNSEPKALGRWTWYWPLRFFVAIMIMIYAIGKLTGGQFHTDPLPQEIAEQTVGELSGFDLAWRFFGYSAVYIVFIGVLQLLGSLLLLFRRTALLGSLVLLPIMINIVLIDWIYAIPGAATFNAILYTLLLLFFVWLERTALIKGLQSLLVEGEGKKPSEWIQILWAIVAFVILFFLSHFTGNQVERFLQ